MDTIWTAILTWATHAGIYTLNCGLFTLYQLWWNLDKLFTLGVVVLILLYFDPQAQHKAAFAPRRYGREGSAAGQGSRTAQWMTAATALLWFVAAFATEPPIPVIGAVMWLAMAVGLLIMPQEREGILWRCKSAILVYALAAIGFRLYLWQINSLSPEDWARIVGSTGDVQAMIQQNRGMFTTIASWFLWLLAPLGYLSLLVQRFTVNPIAMVSPLRSASEVIRDIRTRGEK
ncbi:MAG: hypothetical protein JXM73_15420 [Anaerolineae bacterium]|nr:hypothetical protein [Anaerolineae bacterium]